MAGVIELAWEGELALLTPEVRSDPVRLDGWLADDFREIGQSGRLWRRDEIIAALASEEPLSAAVVSERAERLLGPDTVLLTYRLVFEGRSSRRSSLWRLERGTMRCFFHQGTSNLSHE
jgi:hypothetical protein